MINDIPDRNLFLMCRALNRDALSSLPEGYHARKCTRDELDIWKGFPFDDEVTAKEYYDYMSEFFIKVYKDKEDLFFQRCLFVCDKNDTPIGTCFAWPAYGKVTTIHWFKVKKSYEGLGIGRALLSIVMSSIEDKDYPVFLHTQPASFRAIKLYSDLGFDLLTDPIIGYRQNDVDECLSILNKHMPKRDFDNLRFDKAPEYFLEAVISSRISEF